MRLANIFQLGVKELRVLLRNVTLLLLIALVYLVDFFTVATLQDLSMRMR